MQSNESAVSVPRCEFPEIPNKDDVVVSSTFVSGVMIDCGVSLRHGYVCVMLILFSEFRRTGRTRGDERCRCEVDIYSLCCSKYSICLSVYLKSRVEQDIFHLHGVVERKHQHHQTTD